jgi:hypothetical protein
VAPRAGDEQRGAIEVACRHGAGLYGMAAVARGAAEPRG